MTTAFRHRPFHEKLLTEVASAAATLVGKFDIERTHVSLPVIVPKDVETHLDTYHDYHLTKIETCKRRNLHWRQLRRLQRDPQFKNDSLFIGTAVRVEKDGSLKERKFFFSGAQIEQMGFEPPRLNRTIGDGGSVIAPYKMDLDTYGQYLGGLLANHFVRVQNIRQTNLLPDEMYRLNELLKNLTKKSGFDLHYQGKSNPSP